MPPPAARGPSSWKQTRSRAKSSLAKSPPRIAGSPPRTSTNDPFYRGKHAGGYKVSTVESPQMSPPPWRADTDLNGQTFWPFSRGAEKNGGAASNRRPAPSRIGLENPGGWRRNFPPRRPLPTTLETASANPARSPTRKLCDWRPNSALTIAEPAFHRGGPEKRQPGNLGNPARRGGSRGSHNPQEKLFGARPPLPSQKKDQRYVGTRLRRRNCAKRPSGGFPRFERTHALPPVPKTRDQGFEKNPEVATPGFFFFRGPPPMGVEPTLRMRRQKLGNVPSARLKRGVPLR